jgi:hypothetical protein
MLEYKKLDSIGSRQAPSAVSSRIKSQRRSLLSDSMEIPLNKEHFSYGSRNKNPVESLF